MLYIVPSRLYSERRGFLQVSSLLSNIFYIHFSLNAFEYIAPAKCYSCEMITILSSSDNKILELYFIYE